MRNTVFYGFQFSHHGVHAGFSALKRMLEKKRIRVITVKRPKILWLRGLHRFLPLWMKIQELRLVSYIKSHSTKVIHYFFPENSLYNVTKWKGKSKLIITCHQPVKEGYFELLEKTNPHFIKGVKQADVIILMASKDIKKYQMYAPQAEVVYIPHGVDVEYFSPNNGNSIREKPDGYKHVLTVGNWLRDYEFWVKVAKKVIVLKKNIKFTVVAGKDAHKVIRQGFNNSIPDQIELLQGITDEELRQCYATADIMFLPLIDSWANNAILEAASMSTPIMVTDLPAVREYLTNNLAIFCKNESATNTSNKLIDALNNEADLIERGKALRRHIEKEYSWNRIAEQHIKLYKKLALYQ